MGKWHSQRLEGLETLFVCFCFCFFVFFFRRLNNNQLRSVPDLTGLTSVKTMYVCMYVCMYDYKKKRKLKLISLL